MRSRLPISLMLSCILVAPAFTQNAPPALTIYNQNFAVVRQPLRLDLKAGTNRERYSGITAQLEPDSVVLRDPTGNRTLQILEQNYQADPVSMQSLLEKFEGQTIKFEIRHGDKIDEVSGKIVRAGDGYSALRLGTPQQPCYNPPYGPGCVQMEQPLIEVNGNLQFTLPGTPLFPALPPDTNLLPTLDWMLSTDRAGALDAELSYVTGGMTWEADYNVIAPEKGDTLDLVGWITMDNRTGKTFENAHIALMAGDVNKVQPGSPYGRSMQAVSAGMGGGVGGVPPVVEKTFDEYHLYTLQRSTTLRDRETKQVEFVRAAGVVARRLYVYDGGRIDPARLQQYGGNWEYLRQQRDLGTESSPKVWIMQEFKNSTQNHLGIPLRKGRMRFYRRDEGGALQFVGENTIDHTPRDETLRVYTGNAFDMTGSRRRTNFRIDQQQGNADESFEIKVRNHKTEAVDVTIVEHLYRSAGWDITSSSTKYEKKDSRTVEFHVQIPADGEQIVIYSVHYAW